MDFSVVAPKPSPKKPEKAAPPKPAPAPPPKPTGPQEDEYIPPPKNDITPIIRPRYHHNDHYPCIGGPAMCNDDFVRMQRMKSAELIHSRAYGPNYQGAPCNHHGFYGNGAPRRHFSPPPPRHPQYWSMPPPPPPPPPVSYNYRDYGYDHYHGYYNDDDSYGGCTVM